MADIYKDDFIDECLGGQCDDAVANLVSAIDGNPGLFGCDIMSILYEGDVNGNYYRGWRDVIATKAAYLLTLISSGVNSEAAYRSMTSKNPLAWTSV